MQDICQTVFHFLLQLCLKRKRDICGRFEIFLRPVSYSSCTYAVKSYWTAEISL